jgi:hypothetical protein
LCACGRSRSDGSYGSRFQEVSAVHDKLHS